MLAPGGRHMLWLAVALVVIATVAGAAARVRGSRRRAITPAQIANALERNRAQVVETGPRAAVMSTGVPAATGARALRRR